MTSYLLSSHDGFGLGHVRRNLQLARAVAVADPNAQITLVTGVAVQPRWLAAAELESPIDIVRVPSLVKDDAGTYRNDRLEFEEVIGQRARTFSELVESRRPDVVLIDRHPYGTAGELRHGIEHAVGAGAHVVLGLRDVIDEPVAVRAEMAGAGWDDVADLFDDVFIYGERALCDHEAEYGLVVEPTYTGWVTAPVRPGPVDHRHLVAAGGGGGDAHPIFSLVADLLERRSDWRATILAGPYTGREKPRSGVASRVAWERNVDGFAPWFARAGAVLQMAGYNATAEAIAAGSRPILMPRRSPRREQAIRASRLASLGLADVVDVGADVSEVAWLLDQPRRLDVGAVERAGIRLDGAERAARRLVRRASRRSLPRLAVR